MVGCCWPSGRPGASEQRGGLCSWPFLFCTNDKQRRRGGGRRDLLGTLFLQPGLDSAAVSGEGEEE